MQFLETVKAIVKAETDQGRVVCVLTLNKKWHRHHKGAGVKNEPGVCGVRSSANPSEFKSVCFSTLVVVQNPRPDGLALISERMRGCIDPRTIKVQDYNRREL